ncbi:MAG: hypothetical protein LBC03_02285 [Nitrososphaerota archaeon]|jgi:hypothetical protein|nr:hypothetical protein [Nitrososphaerota archaeon]
MMKQTIAKLQPKPKPKQAVYFYEVFPVIFVMLPKTKAYRNLRAISTTPKQLTYQVKLSTVKTQKTLEINEAQLSTTYYRFFIESLEPIDWIVEQCGFKQQPLTEIPQPKTRQIFPKHLQLENNKLERTFTAHQLPGTLLPGFVCELYGLCKRVLICVKPLAPEPASSQMGKYVRLLKIILLTDQSKGSHH